MDKYENQQKFLIEFNNFVDSIKSNDERFKKFIEMVKEHHYFKDFKKTIDNNIDSYGLDGVKLFIFSNFTNDREKCSAICQLLRKCELVTQAEILEQYNISSGPNEIIYENELKVAIRASPYRLLSRAICLEKSIRGKCIIINNVEESQSPPYPSGDKIITPIGLKNETERYKSIFTQLYFEVIIFTKLNAKQIKRELSKISKDRTLINDEAFVLIVISHGGGEMISGYDACEEIRKRNFGEITNLKDIQESKKIITKDIISIEDINALFSYENSFLKGKPKLMFYSICRAKEMNDQVTNSKSNVTYTHTPPQPKVYTDMAVIYTCTEGFRTFYDAITGFTYFGQAFTHSIAQYACDEPFDSIMSRTSKRLNDLYKDLEDKTSMGNFAIETNYKSITFQLYFNPGHPRIRDLSESNFDIQNQNTISEDFTTNIVSNQSEIALKNKILEENNEWENIDITKLCTEFKNFYILGSGAFGTVLKTEDNSNQEYAIKIIKFESEDKEERDKVFREVTTLRKCDPIYVVQYIDSWIEGDYLFIKLELCSDNFQSIINEKPIFFRRKGKEAMSVVEYFVSCELFKELLECVKHLHALNVMHRDLKPRNILMFYKPKNGRFLKLGDFGLAKFYGNTLRSQTNHVGTFPYIAHEVAKGRKYGNKADIFSLGVIGQNLFSVEDIYEENLENIFIIEKNLKNHWEELINSLIDMSNNRPSKRPTCDQLLESSKVWSVNIDKITIENSLKEDKYNLDEDNFFLNYLKYKLGF